jgi:hypothetical protein
MHKKIIEEMKRQKREETPNECPWEQSKEDRGEKLEENHGLEDLDDIDYDEEEPSDDEAEEVELDGEGDEFSDHQRTEE